MRALAVAAAALSVSGCSFDERGPGAAFDGAAAKIDAPARDAGAPDGRPDAAPVGCDGDEDCAAPPSPCLLPGTCNLVARTCEFAPVDCSPLDGECAAGACDPSTGACAAQPAREAEACGAGLMVCGDFSACDFADTCAESGAQSRTCTDNTCRDGSCSASSYQDTQPCTRSTEGTTCMATDCSPFGACAGFSSICDETGSHSRTCTAHTCHLAACGSTATTEIEACSRTTDGMTCNTPTCGSAGPCGGFATTCDETGTTSRSCTPYRCGAGACNPGAPFVETLDCTRDTEGTSCGMLCEEGGCADYCCAGGICPFTIPGGNCME